MSPAETATDAPITTLVEPFVRYRVDWSAATGRTDTPDLVGLFGRRTQDALLAEGYEEMAADDLELAEGDMAAGAETLPAE
jgi:hypothetical protein